MSAPQERPSSGIPLLEYGDLVYLGECGPSILKPSQIPVHPSVFKAPEFYTTDFAQKVFSLVPDSIRQDIAVIQAKTGQELPVVLTPDGISDKESWGREELFKDFNAFARFEGIQVTIEPPNTAGGTNTYLRRTEQCCDYYPAIPEELARKYEYKFGDAKSEIGSRTPMALIVWNVHNLNCAPLPVQLTLRNFAIMFNNLGLQELGIK